MRITNNIMQRNNLSNINTNKIYQDTLSTQMSTQKKVNRPSDDPVVAIRALRLRSNVTEITQYYSKNIPDANSWLNVTEDALKNLSQIVTNMITNCTKGSNGDLKSTDRQIILEQLGALRDEVYATGDADYAGRYVFTGYRTDTSLSFPAATTQNYEITEQLQNSVIDKVTKVNTGEMLNWNNQNFNTGTIAGINENQISSSEVYRIRLSYNNCEAGFAPTIQVPAKDANGDYIYDADYNVEYTDLAYPTTVMHSYDVGPNGENPYEFVAKNPDSVVFVPETGEMLLGENAYAALMKLKDEASTVADEGQFRVTYQKSDWQSGDLRPEHYYYCESEGIQYNTNYLTAAPERQNIEYDVGFNQTIRVNSTADECFKPGIGREVDDLIATMQEVVDIETVRDNIKNALKSAVGADADVLQKQLAAAEKAYTLAKDKCQKMFEGGITSLQGYLDDANLCITNCGTRSAKLELIGNRMQNQKTTFETLKSENEDVDITEVAINLSSAGLTYQAALMATGKIAQTTLLNYI
ncbi:MAG: hypothetical protein K6G30_08595 [Acetatifactor sp.]|nr:hypothetical protein [Acetatifactor sp.]